MDVVKWFGKVVYRLMIKIFLIVGYLVRNGSLDEVNGSLVFVVIIVFVIVMIFVIIGIFGFK